MTPPATRSTTSAGLRVGLHSSRRPFARACPPVPLTAWSWPTLLNSLLHRQGTDPHEQCEPDIHSAGSLSWMPLAKGTDPPGFQRDKTRPTLGDGLEETNWPLPGRNSPQRALALQGLHRALVSRLPNGAHRCQSSGSSSTIGHETAALPSSLFSPTVFAQSSVARPTGPFLRLLSNPSDRLQVDRSDLGSAQAEVKYSFSVRPSVDAQAVRRIP